MGEINCEACGRPVDDRASVCPHCGNRRRRGLSRVWVLTFFILGILMGLLLLILQQGEPPSWLAFDWPENATVEEVVQRVGKATKLEPKSKTTGYSKVEPMRCDREKALARGVDECSHRQKNRDGQTGPRLPAVVSRVGRSGGGRRTGRRKGP